ncbi:MAG: hypothetical protein JXB38_12235, partial [Anaerolineales bacterium]|nr:hypothetical protein [Anaerolineales bacterium]
APKDAKHVFHPGRGRLARVGYGSRFFDALFSLTLFARGRVPGDTAAAAALTYQGLMQQNEQYRYYGRVLRRDGWIALQYWFFYAFNNWRSGFHGVNDHEADWESMLIFLYEDGDEVIPEWVAYAAHDFEGDDIRRRWDDPELERIGEHPVVYVGAGSHASYFTPGEYLAEIEVPFLSPFARLVDYLQKSWHRLMRNALGEEGNNNEGFNVFRIPFVDYARGDGIRLGHGQERSWSEPVVISRPPDWVHDFRGLWGLYAQDPVSGEDAPAGPMYNRDGSVRHSWYDPIGWVGLDKVGPPNLSAKTARRRAREIQNRQDTRRVIVAEKSSQLRDLDVEVRAMLDQPHLDAVYTEHQRKMKQLSAEINDLRAQTASDEALLQALTEYIAKHEAGKRSPVRGHLHRPQRPADEVNLRISRLAEVWSALSIGIMMLGFVGIVLLAREYLTVGLAALLSLVILIEASFRRQLAKLLTSLTNLMAFFALLVLLYEFFWQAVVVSVLTAGTYIMWVNVRELVSRK